MLFCPLWNSIFKIWDSFWGDANRNTMQQKLFQNYFIKWSWNFGKKFNKCFNDIWSVNDLIQMVVAFKDVVIL